MVDAVAFDFGGVLVHSLVPTMQVLAERHGVEVGTILEVLMGPQTHDTEHPWHRAERGDLAVEDIQEALGSYADQHGVALHGDEIELIMSRSEFPVSAPVLDRILRLRAEGYRTALVTNAFKEFRPTLEGLVDLPALFDVTLDSSEIGVRKPSPRLFEILRERLGIDQPSRIVLLDDFVGNIEGARAAGLRAIQVTDTATALAELDELLGWSADPGGAP